MNRAIFIISYKRANNVITLETLKKLNYSGKYYIVVDDKDPELDIYKQKFGENLCIFSKDEAKKIFDTCDNFDNTNSSCFVRNYLFKIAKDKKIDSFLVLDDDYEYIFFRKIVDNKLKVYYFKDNDFDKAMDIWFDYLEKTDLIDCYALAQVGDLIGGAGTINQIDGKRKIMNAFFCKTSKPFEFKGKMNEDVNAYIYYGSRGKVFFTTTSAIIKPALTQQVNGGMTDIYKNNGTYVKSFYTVMLAPNCCKISTIGMSNFRIHHKIKWNNAVPKIIREEYKK